ncbi:hypothetical protein [Herbaspirillum sp. YR522]|uniref:hypothetical protein n=1 Tax=Herbaspirillum sp. YR522 TaxID=1144342 RepID=UPI00026FAAA3|nr:hypothetical protein [Herbaspirillum sp. YR522]EJN09811.1 hypothetical protein PMI40_00506 [Herbaspirillum sp. YR522]
MQTEKTVDLLYVHSPITYSIGRYLHDHGYLKNEQLVVCGRKTTWHAPHINVGNDGIWDIGGACDFLEKVCQGLAGLGPVALNLYVPHSGFLLGKLFGMAGVVKSIFYLEEGSAAYDPENVTDPWNSVEVDTELLTRELERRGIIDTLRIDRDKLSRINSVPSYFFDGRHPAYAGAYCVSEKAFTHLTKVTVLNLECIEIIPQGEQVWVCLLPCLLNYFSALEKESDRPMLDKLLYGLILMVRMQSALVQNAGGALVIKFHPADDAYFKDAFKQNYYRYGTAYDAFFKMNEFDAGYEPGLYNFTKFIVINPSSASLYIEQFRGADHLVEVRFD